MIVSENRFPLFRIMLNFLAAHDLFGKPVSTFPDHALGLGGDEVGDLELKPAFALVHADSHAFVCVGRDWIAEYRCRGASLGRSRESGGFRSRHRSRIAGHDCWYDKEAQA
jgi:hypothetical protein